MSLNHKLNQIFLYLPKSQIQKKLGRVNGTINLDSLRL